jgi:transposase, IS5 family
VEADRDAAETLASQASFERYGRKSRRELFLEEMDRAVPWAELEALVEPHYAKASSGRRPMGLGIMLGLTSCSSGLTCRTPA